MWSALNQSLLKTTSALMSPLILIKEPNSALHPDFYAAQKSADNSEYSAINLGDTDNTEEATTVAYYWINRESGTERQSKSDSAGCVSRAETICQLRCHRHGTQHTPLGWYQSWQYDVQLFSSQYWRIGRWPISILCTRGISVLVCTPLWKRGVISPNFAVALFCGLFCESFSSEKNLFSN